MILVTGAAGKTGRAVIRALSTNGAAVRALVHRPEQVGLVQGLGAQQALVGDMRQWFRQPRDAGPSTTYAPT